MTKVEAGVEAENFDAGQAKGSGLQCAFLKASSNFCSPPARDSALTLATVFHKGREREREKETERQREREREGQKGRSSERTINEMHACSKHLTRFNQSNLASARRL